MRVEWSLRAIQHLTHLRKYIGQDNPSAAARVAERILLVADLLKEYPDVGRAGRVAGTRELVVPDTPYIVAYRMRVDRVEIAAVLHGRQRWPKTL